MQHKVAENKNQPTNEQSEYTKTQISFQTTCILRLAFSLKGTAIFAVTLGLVLL